MRTPLGFFGTSNIDQWFSQDFGIGGGSGGISTFSGVQVKKFCDEQKTSSWLFSFILTFSYYPPPPQVPQPTRAPTIQRSCRNPTTGLIVATPIT